jgi:hypothetical protein
VGPESQRPGGWIEPQRRLQQWKTAVPGQIVGMGQLDDLIQVVGNEPQAVSARNDFRLCAELYCRGDDRAAFPGREGRSRGAPEPWRGRAGSLRHPPVVDCDQLAANIHAHSVHSSIHALNASCMIEEGDGH